MSLPRAESYTSHLQKIICLAAIFQAADLCLPGNLKQCWSSIAAGKKENGSRKRQQKQPDIRYIGMEFSQTSDFEVTMKGSRSFCFGSPLAQRVGFEPTCGCPQTDFEKCAPHKFPYKFVLHRVFSMPNTMYFKTICRAFHIALQGLLSSPGNIPATGQQFLSPCNHNAGNIVIIPYNCTV